MGTAEERLSIASVAAALRLYTLGESGFNSIVRLSKSKPSSLNPYDRRSELALESKMGSLIEVLLQSCSACKSDSVTRPIPPIF